MLRDSYFCWHEYKIPLHSFKKAPRCLTSSSHVFLGFWRIAKASNIIGCRQHTRECVSGNSWPRDNGITAGGPSELNTEANRPVSSRKTVGFVMSVARRLVYSPRQGGYSLFLREKTYCVAASLQYALLTSTMDTERRRIQLELRRLIV